MIWKFVNPSEFDLFLHKYDLKQNQNFMQVLKLDKENPIKQKIHTFIYCGTLSSLKYLWMAKVCDLGPSEYGAIPFCYNPQMHISF